MKQKWSDTLPSDVYNRLCSCCTTAGDIRILVNHKWMAMKNEGKDAKGFVKEDALLSVLELLDCNGQFFDLTRDEYNSLKKD